MCILRTYLWYSSTLKVGVLVVGVGGELSLLTPWFKEVSCTLSRFPCIALLWFANFSLFIGVPRITRSYDEARSNYYFIFIFNPFWRELLEDRQYSKIIFYIDIWINTNINILKQRDKKEYIFCNKYISSNTIFLHINYIFNI